MTDHLILTDEPKLRIIAYLNAVGQCRPVHAGALQNEAVLHTLGHATFHRVNPKYYSAVLLGLVLPAGAVVSAAITSAVPALKLSVANPEVQAALNRSIYWSSVQGLGNGFLFLVLVMAALVTETIDRNFGRASIWCLVAAAFSWLGLMHSPIFRWGAQPMYAIGWLAAAAIVFSARWWRGDLRASSRA